jgi:CheY-like chemotaxis protein
MTDEFPDLAGVTLLLVDDNEDALISLARLLQTCNAVVRKASSGKEALEQLQTETPDVVITDLSMPGMTGVELLHCIRSRPQSRQIPVVALTAYEREYVSAGREFDAFFRKPSDVHVLCATILALSRNRRR